MGLCWDLRVNQLIQPLARLGVRVDSLQIPSNPLKKRWSFYTHYGYDILWLHRHVAWPWHLSLLHNMARGIVFDIADPVCFNPKNPAEHSWTRSFKFAATCRASHGVTAASPELARLAQPFNPNVAYIPTAFASEQLASEPIRRQPGEPLKLLWIGSKSTFRYLQQRQQTLEAIGQRVPDCELIMMGAGEPFELKHMRVRSYAWDPVLQPQLLREGHVGLSPLADDRWSRGKSALKPQLYAANGVPIVGDDIGYNQVIADAGNVGLLAQSNDDWIKAVVTLCDEPTRFKMGQRGIELMKKHDQQIVAERIADFFFACQSRSLLDREPVTKWLRQWVEFQRSAS